MELIYITLILSLVVAIASVFVITDEAKRAVQRKENQVFELRDDLHRERDIVSTLYGELDKAREQVKAENEEIKALRDKVNDLELTIRALLKEHAEGGQEA
jgi:peptidoglycan hydrolase CwlO-like protein